MSARAMCLLAGWLLGAASAAQAAAPAPDASQGADTLAVGELVRNYAEAQVQMDSATLGTLTAPQFIEISPGGEVDPREKMLGFYVKNASHVPPALVIDERMVTLLGDTALVNARLNFTMSANGQSRSFAMRSTFVAHKEGAQWKLYSAQHTPIRPPQP